MSRKMRKHASLPETPGPRLSWVFSGLMRQVTGDLNRVQEHPEEAIHALRRRMKKLQSLFRLVDGLADKETKDRIKKLILGIKNAFTDQRDQAVIESLAFNVGGRPLAHQVAQKQKNTELRPMATCLTSAATLAGILSALPVKKLTWIDIREAHEQTVEKAHRRWQRALEEPTAKHLHECRKQTKALCYQLLFIRLIKGHQKRKIHHARRLGHWLGKHHDLHLFQTTLRHQKLLNASRQADINHREKKLCQRALQVGRKLYGN